MNKLGTSLIYFLFSSQSLLLHGQDPEGFSHYIYLSDQRVITVELIDEEEVILNYINLGETFEIIQAPMLLILDVERNIYRGHLMKSNSFSDSNKRFQVSKLIKPLEYEGFDIVGNYQFLENPERALLKIGARIIMLQPLSADEFELVASRIAGIDLEINDGKKMLMGAGFQQGYGEIYNAGDEDIVELEKHFPDLVLISPVVLSKPNPLLPKSFNHLPDPVIVLLEVIVTQSGGVVEIKVLEGIDPILDQIAVQTVRNSWIFLPAISEGQISSSEVTLEVVFLRN